MASAGGNRDFMLARGRDSEDGRLHFNMNFEGVREQEGAGRPGKQRNPVWLKHEVQGSLGVERPFTL